jgi:hypothetical protein
MPPQGWSSGRDETKVIAVRLPNWLLEKVDQHLKWMMTQSPLLRLNRSDAARDLINRGFETVDPGETVPGSPSAPSAQPSGDIGAQFTDLSPDRQRVVRYVLTHPNQSLKEAEIKAALRLARMPRLRDMVREGILEEQATGIYSVAPQYVWNEDAISERPENTPQNN